MLILAILLSVVTFIGMIAVLTSGGERSAGYAIIPMVFSLGFIAAYKKLE